MLAHPAVLASGLGFLVDFDGTGSGLGNDGKVLVSGGRGSRKTRTGCPKLSEKSSLQFAGMKKPLSLRDLEWRP